MKVVILSGIAGSGKSSWIKAQPWADNAAISSADHFFMKAGVYKFDPSKLEAAHGQCLRLFMNDMEDAQIGKKYPDEKLLDLVVDNTNLSSEEIAPYYSIARAYGYDVELVTLHTDPFVAASRNVHGVSLETCKRMHGKLMERKFPSFWNLTHSQYSWDDRSGWTKLGACS